MGSGSTCGKSQFVPTLDRSSMAIIHALQLPAAMRRDDWPGFLLHYTRRILFSEDADSWIPAGNWGGGEEIVDVPAVP